MSLTREQIDKAPVTTKEVEVPEMGIKNGTVFVRKLDADGVADIAELHDKVQGASEKEQIKFLYRTVALTVSDEDGKRLYDDDATAVIGGWPFEALKRVAEAALKLNGMDAKSSEARRRELARPLAGSSSRSRRNGRAATAKRRAVRHRKKSSSVSR